VRRPTPTETERIARACPPEGLTVPIIVEAIRVETGCSRATATEPSRMPSPPVSLAARRTKTRLADISERSAKRGGPIPSDEARVNVVDQRTESPTNDTASGNPLDLLPLRQFVVLCRPIVESRENCLRKMTRRTNATDGVPLTPGSTQPVSHEAATSLR
jgi:hypothetical protein